MHYLIDGYNLLFRLPDQKRSLEEGREQIIASLLHIKLSLTIVFDGGCDDIPHRTHKGPLEIVYTAKKETADNYIIDEISWVKKPGNYTVVTSDKKLGLRCQSLGAKTESIAAFLRIIEKKQRILPNEKPLKDHEKHFQRLLAIFTRAL